MSQRAVLIVAAILLTTTACQEKSAATPEARRPAAAAPALQDHPPSADQAVQEDAAAYAKEFGVAPDEAERRIRLRPQQDEAVERLRAADRGRFAGLWIEHQPQFRIVVRLKGDAPAGRELAERAQGSSIPVVFVTGATATEDDVLTKIRTSLGAFKTALPDLAGTDYDVKTGEIVLYVYATGAAAESARGRGTELTRAIGHPVRVEILPAPLRDQDVRGGAPISGCTSAFVVVDGSSNRGVVTAGHCNDTQTYSGYDGTNTSMTFKAEMRDADRDLQWHTTPIAEIPEFYADQTTSARVLTGRRLRSSTAVGDPVCHRGQTSGHSCGTVKSTTFQPTYADACPATCNAVWVSVTGAQLACAGGDSGGAWFNGQTAFGVHKGGSSTGSAQGQCSMAWYTSTDFISGLSLSLVFGR